jgi:hypothetical protein
MHLLRVAVSVAGLVTIASLCARAQEPDTLSAAQRAGLALARLGDGQWVRLRGSRVGLIEGSVVSSSPTLVTLRTDGLRVEVPAPGVDSLWVLGSHAGSGALIGGAVGGIGLGVLAAAVANSFNCKSCTSDVAEVRLVGAAGGALIGALIGAAVPKWRLRVP